MKIRKINHLLEGSCNECKKGKLDTSGTFLLYPYGYVYEIEIGEQTPRLCEDCFKELIKLLNKEALR